MATIYRRPVFSYPSVANGVYDAEIKFVSIETGKNPFSDDGSDRTVLVCKIKVFDGVNSVELRYAPTLPEKDWGDNSNINKMLDSLGILPDEGEEIDFDILVGRKVTVCVKNMVKDGKSFCNITQILPARATSPVVIPAAPTVEQIPTAEPSLDD